MPFLSKLFKRKSRRPPSAADAPPQTTSQPADERRTGPGANPVRVEREPSAPENAAPNALLDNLIDSITYGLSAQHTTAEPAGPGPSIPLESDRGVRYFGRINAKTWPDFDSSDLQDAINASGQRFLDHTNSVGVQWAKGARASDAQYGPQRFPPKYPDGLGPDMLPPLLFDLSLGRVVRAVDVGRANYMVISHVWGPVQDIDGREYGVDWKIPMRNQDTLTQILEAARIMGGTRFIWMDVLCMDQRQRNEREIAQMKTYLTNATGCLVWLDNASDEPFWPEVLDAIKQINKFYHLDAHGTPTMSAMEMIGPNGVLTNMSLSQEDMPKWIRQLLLLEKAPWFRRVWTLQEAVISDRLLFCTPERYMVGEFTLFLTTALYEKMAHSTMAGGDLSGTAVIQLLQKSEIYKLLKLRQAYRKDQLSYWHLAQALRTRECKYEQDRVFGICGLIRRPLPAIDYNRSLEMLNRDLFRTFVEDGDFSPFFFLGGDSSLSPDRESSVGFLTPRLPNTNPNPNFNLTFGPDYLDMKGIGVDVVHVSICIGSSISPSSTSSPLASWAKESPHFLQYTESHPDIARAFDLTPEVLDNGNCPAAYAAIGALILGTSPAGANAVGVFGPEVKSRFEKAVPSALLTWTRLRFLAQDRDAAFVVVWSHGNGAQLAVVTEPIPRELGRCIIVMPGQYKDSPGPGCLICVRSSDDKLRKIGVGLGKLLKPAGVVNAVLAMN